MINPKNSLILAHTKLKTRKIRTIVTVVISSLMFSLLIFAVLIFEGLYQRTTTTFAHEGLSSSNLVRASSHREKPFFQISLEQKNYIDKLTKIEVSKRHKRAKELKLPFDEKAEFDKLKPYHLTDNEGPAEIYMFEHREDNPIAWQFLTEQPDYKDFKIELTHGQKLAQASQATQISTAFNSNLRPNFYQAFSPDERGDYNYRTKQQKDGSALMNEAQPDIYQIGQDDKDPKKSLINHLVLTPATLHQPFLFDNSSWRPESGRVPILVSLDNLTTIFKLTSPDFKNRSSKQQVEFLKQIRQKAQDYVFTVCHYNSLATEQLEQANLYHKTQPGDRHKFELVYDLPDTKSCTVPKLLQDKRSADQKDFAQRQAQYQHEFEGRPLAAEAIAIDYQIVGVLPPTNSFGREEDFALSIMRLAISGPQMANMIPQDKLLRLPNLTTLSKIFDFTVTKTATSTQLSNSYYDFYLAYQTPELAKQAIEQYNCQPDYEAINSQKFDDFAGLFAHCKKEKSFFLVSFATQAMNMITTKQWFYNFIKIIGGIFSIIAIVIMAGTIGRLISDGRRETAVFRAIGFKRFDISMIYLTYSLLICLMTVATALALAIIPALILNSYFANELTNYALWLFNAKNYDLKVQLYDFNWILLGLIGLMIIGSGLISTVLPLLSNLRRNPIKDMRDE